MVAPIALPLLAAAVSLLMGGLGFSTLVSLLLVPCVYSLTHGEPRRST